MSFAFFAVLWESAVWQVDLVSLSLFCLVDFGCQLLVILQQSGYCLVPQECYVAENPNLADRNEVVECAQWLFEFRL